MQNYLVLIKSMQLIISKPTSPLLDANDQLLHQIFRYCGSVLWESVKTKLRSCKEPFCTYELNNQ